MTLEQRKEIIRQASAIATQRYSDTQRQLAFAEGFMTCAYNIDTMMLSPIDISEREPQSNERVFAMRHEDDSDIELLNYDRELFTKLGVKYWLPFTFNIQQHV